MDASGISAINGNYALDSSGKLNIDIDGITAGTGFDQLIINGVVDLNADSSTGGTLDLDPSFAFFIIIDYDGADTVSGNFSGLTDGASFNETFGNNLFTFTIDSERVTVTM